MTRSFLSEEERCQFDRIASPPPLRVVTDDEDRAGPVFGLLSELDAARFFAREYGNRIRHCSRAGGWFIWDGKRWAADDDGAVYRLAAECTDQIVESANRVTDLEARKKILNFVIGLRKRRGIENFVTLAGNLQGVSIGNPDRFDADPWLLNADNGIVDLRSGELRPHDRDLLLTKLVPIAYEPEATCERWERFLREIFDDDAQTIAFVQRATGYSMTGITREHAFLVLYGIGANGKSSLLSLLGRVAGDYGLSASPETFVDRQAGAATNDLARLRGMRFVSAIETSEGRALAESFIKAVTGGDRIAARFLYAEYFDFEPVFKLWLGTNHKPVIRGGDEGIWRRVKLVPFDQRFEGERCDPDLRAKLEEELPGILAWAVRGCLDWQKHGLKAPPAVTGATEAYRSEMDMFSGFIDERCEIDEDANEAAGALYAAYRAWADGNGEKALSQRWFTLRLTERGFKKVRQHGGKRCWSGIRVTHSAEG